MGKYTSLRTVSVFQHDFISGTFVASTEEDEFKGTRRRTMRPVLADLGPNCVFVCVIRKSVCISSGRWLVLLTQGISGKDNLSLTVCTGLEERTLRNLQSVSLTGDLRVYRHLRF